MDDLISRQDAIDAINQLCQNQCPHTERIREIGACCGSCFVDDCTQIILDLPSADEQLESAYAHGYTEAEAHFHSVRDIATIIENEKDMRVIVKNAEPERKTGRWEMEWLPSTNGGHYQVFRCTECHNAFNWRMNFCGHCGADMRGEEE